MKAIRINISKQIKYIVVSILNGKIYHYYIDRTDTVNKRCDIGIWRVISVIMCLLLVSCGAIKKNKSEEREKLQSIEVAESKDIKKDTLHVLSTLDSFEITPVFAENPILIVDSSGKTTRITNGKITVTKKTKSKQKGSVLTNENKKDITLYKESEKIAENKEIKPNKPFWILFAIGWILLLILIGWLNYKYV